MSAKRLVVRAVAVVAVAAAAAGALWWFRGFHVAEVIPGRVYRSPQPSASELRAATERLHLATVINLRGAQPDEPWYPEELAASQALHLDRVDLRFHSFDWPPREETRRLVTALGSARSPMLLHCMAGVHRTGWASAVALALAGEPLDRVRAELANVPRTLGQADPEYGRRFFDLYEAWLSAEGGSHDAATFRRWALEVYCPPPYDAEIEILSGRPEDAVAPGAWLRLSVAVTNRSDQSWELSSAPGHGFRLGATLLGPYATLPDDALAQFRTPGRPGRDLARAGIEDGAIEPGERRELELDFQAPEEAGQYLVQVDMVEELVHWFSDLGTPGVIFDLRVAAPDAG